MRKTLKLLALLAAAGLGAAACADGPTQGKPAEQQANVAVSVNLANTGVRQLAVHVEALDIPTPLVFNIPVSDSTAWGRITVPAGSNRGITVRAYDAQGALTHEGRAVVSVRPGENVNLSIVLVPRPGELPITVSFGSLMVSIERLSPGPTGTGDRAGDTIDFRAVVRQPDGTQVGNHVEWASTNPGIATIDPMGRLYALRQGTIQIVATSGGFAAAHTVVITSATDTIAPELRSFTITPDTLQMELGWSKYVTVEMDVVDTGTGLDSLSLTAWSVATPRSGFVCYPGLDAGTGLFTCKPSFASYQPAGDYTITEVRMVDKGNNGVTLTTADLAARGFDSSFHVLAP